MGESGAKASSSVGSEYGEPKANGAPNHPEVIIDLEGISARVVPFPVAEGRFGRIAGLEGKVLFLSYAGNDHTSPIFGQSRGKIECYNFESYKVEWSIEDVSDFALSRDAKMLIYRKAQRLRVLKATEKPKDNSEGAGRESGWLELDRVKVSVQPAAEWRQMFAEAWRLQREYFWAADMVGLDWPAMYAQYAPLVERVGSRGELSDLIWELQGELGTSHAYEQGGDYGQWPHYGQGYLGVDWHYDAQRDRYQFARIIQGDPAEIRETSALNAPGLNVREGDAVLAVNGQRVGRARSPQELLVNQAGCEVQLTVEDGERGEVRTIIVKALSSEREARYRDWVKRNCQRVHDLSQGRVGYLHIPDMFARGFAEFCRGYVEFDRPGLIIDVRWNGGGHISSLVLEKLALRRVGYRYSRWKQAQPYPVKSPAGPMVALANSYTGSDAEKFCHAFQLLELGPVIGTRTWGGTIGIDESRQLVDGTIVNQPECLNWFSDVGGYLENHGVEPDIEVEIVPGDELDTQLDRAINECFRLIERSTSLKPGKVEGYSE